MTKRYRLLIAALAALPLACSGGSAAEVSSAGAPRSAQAPAAAAQPPGSAPAPAPATAPALPEGTRVQRTAHIDLNVASGRFDQAINRVLTLVDQEGGFVAGSGGVQPATGSSTRTGQLSFQVPTAKFDATLVALRKLGDTRRFNVSGTDVSTQYVDLQARLANEERQRDAFLALLGRAQSIQDIVTLQNQLGQVTGQIEQLKGQIDFLDHTTTYGTLTVTVTEVPTSASPSNPPGLQGALYQGARNFLAVVDFVVVALATLAPFLLIAGIGGACWWLWRRRRPAAVTPAGSPS